MLSSLFLSSNSSPTAPDPSRLASGTAAGLLALLFAAVSPTAATADAPSLSASCSPQWQEHFGTQAARLLNSEIEEVKTTTLQTLIAIGSRNCAVDVSPAVTALFDVYRTDANLQHRIMAATALRQVATHAANGDRIMYRLNELVAEQPSERVQRLTLRMLADYEQQQGRTLRLTPALYDLVVDRSKA